MHNQRYAGVPGVLAIAMLLLAACGRTLADNGADTDGGGTFSCAEATCSATEVCVHLTCGPAQCTDIPAGGCPAGWIQVAQCEGASTATPSCKKMCGGPNWPFCRPRPTACGGTLSCDCVNDVCGEAAASCSSISERDVTCTFD